MKRSLHLNLLLPQNLHQNLNRLRLLSLSLLLLPDPSLLLPSSLRARLPLFLHLLLHTFHVLVTSVFASHCVGMLAPPLTDFVSVSEH